MAPTGRGVFHVDALLPCNARTMLIERDSAAFRSLLSKSLKIGQMEFRDIWNGEDSSTFVRLVTKPEFGAWVPKSVASSVKSSQLEFHDIIQYNPREIAQSPYRIFVRTESPMLGDKLDIQLTLTIEEVDAETCRQSLDGHIIVRIFGVGRVVEAIVKESLVNTYKKLPDIVRRWQAFRAEALAAGNERALLLGRPPVGGSVSWIRREVLALEAEEGQDIEVAALAGGAAAQPSPAGKPPQQEEEGQAMGDGGVPPPEPTRSPSPGQRRSSTLRLRASLQQSQHSGQQLQASTATTMYFDAQEEVSDAESREGDDAEQLQQPAVQLLPAVPSSLLTGPPPPEQQQGGAHHHQRSSSMESVGLSPDADIHAHKASLALWTRFNHYWGDWQQYWHQQGVGGEEGEGADEQEREGEQGSLIGQLLGTVGREMYYGSALLVLVVYLGLTRRGVVIVHPDTPRRRHQSAGGAGSAPPSGLGQRRTVSLDRAEAEVAARLVKAKLGLRPEYETCSGGASATICPVPGGSNDGSSSRGDAKLSRNLRGSSEAAQAEEGFKVQRHGCFSSLCFCRSKVK